MAGPQESTLNQSTYGEQLTKYKQIVDIDKRPQVGSDSLELLSLKDIILDKEPVMRGHEQFFKLSDGPSDDEN